MGSARAPELNGTARLGRVAKLPTYVGNATRTKLGQSATSPTVLSHRVIYLRPRAARMPPELNGVARLSRIANLRTQWN